MKNSGLIDKLEMHQPAVTDAVTLKGYRQNLAVSKFLSGLSPALRSQVQGQIPRGGSILTLTATFSRVMRVSTGADVFSASSIDQSDMYSGRGRAFGHGRSSGGERDLFGTGRNFSSGKHNKGPRHYKHCGRSNHISEKCWVKFG